MANIYKNSKLSLTSSGVNTLYTVPANSRAIAKSLLVSEDAGGAAVAQVTLIDSSGTVFVIDNDVDLSANQKEQVFSEPLIMEESEILKINVTSGAADIVVSILEINREDL